MDNITSKYIYWKVYLLFMFLAQSVKKISKQLFEFLKIITFLFSMVVVCFGEVLFCKNQVLLKGIQEVSSFVTFLMALFFVVLILISQASLFFYILLFLEISFLFNISILILFNKIQVPLV